MIRAENFYIVRTPLLPVNTITQLFPVSKASLSPVIKNIFRDPYLREAIYIASPELYQELQKWLTDPAEDGKAAQKLAAALYRYLLRMSSRCTPYGLFAGCATGALADHTAIRLADKYTHKKHSRLDMNYVAELATAITAIPGIRAQLNYYPNNSLYAAGTQYRYAAYTVKNKIRNYYLTAVNDSPYLKKMLQTAATGATLTDIRDSIVSEEADISEEEAAAFTEELLQHQILVSELEPAVTGEEFFVHLVKRLKELNGTEALTATLDAIQQGLQQQQYTKVHQLVSTLLTNTSSKDLVQTDLFVSATENTLSHTVINELTTQVSQLWKLGSQEPDNDLAAFCRAFRQRYEEQEMPLALVLDAEAGIGYGPGHNTDHTPLADDFHLSPPDTGGSHPRTLMQDFQLHLLQESLWQQKKVILLTREQLDTFKEKATPALPASMYLMGSILSNSAEAIDNGDYLFDMNGCSGPSAANLLGRFCHGDEKLATHVKACLREEEAGDPEKIYAEIVHLPESRTGNILMRPRLREHEIVYLANSQTPEAMQLPLSDLLVSVRQNKVVMRSRRLNKIIVPRLSTAHNYKQGLPVYKFLCDLQYQDYQTGIGWHWQLPGDIPFYPRVQYGNIILSKSTWVLHKKKYAALTKAPVEAYMDIFREIRHQLALPRYVLIREGDNELPADLESEVSVHLLVTQLLKKEQVTLQEFLATPDICWIKGPDGLHTHELIIPLKNISPGKNKSTAPVFTNTTQLPARKFYTGSEWLYVKLYAGTRSAENILKEKLLPLTQSLLEEKVIDQWFFIRYSDPDHHLRIRFHHAAHPQFWSIVLQRLYDISGNDASIQRIQTDTYEREIERYGGDTMLFSEALFHLDSECVLGILQLLEEEEGENYRWLLALRGIHMLLDDFGYTLSARSGLLHMLQQSFFEEHGGEKSLLLQLNNKYREEMRKVSQILDPAQDNEQGIEAAVDCFRTRSAGIQRLLSGITLKNRDELLCSYIHMFLNRILLSNQRKQELVLYHFLSRYYASQLAVSAKAVKAML
ncbi:lantibiotic dehydratase [Chitinophaga arvensicola]|uniref:Thiopeptide-type bacteriocin biosynthesis domain-containing protein n=1 Tax=Chitinophaga arvensicola TaxID=29529 RepID=A0A1I0S813_9BACT|nr:lantibiotic dehydratase [Chitinophaga arvensicola]SEW52060.1 thiopeptide-type bacteriocin biosynthesis domain-containing protein [Chitinophaga arvensicola]